MTAHRFTACILLFAAAAATPARADAATPPGPAPNLDPPTIAAATETVPPVAESAGPTEAQCSNELIRIWSDYPNAYDHRLVEICWPPLTQLH
ncbi:hypothetical protein ATO13_14240 [Stappia sp. 22II-S9-Z10]|nr:hypothetical protein ATO13_14240 [Stappia sp. 22II-S9-Z10]